jgi:hypothetical protein
MADWSATENFDSYSVGGLNGNNGGSGWSAAWVSNAAGVVSVTQFQSSPNGLLCADTVGNSVDATRTLTTGVTTGICRVYMLAVNVPTGTKGYYPALFYEGVNLRFVIGWGTNATFNNANNIAFGDNGTNWVTLSTTASAATWYYVDVEFDKANNRARASFNGGAWSSYVTASGGSYTQIDKLRITTADGNAVDQGYYIDSIGVGTGPATATTASFIPTLLTLGVG